MKLSSIQQAYLEARRAARRFPFVLVCSLVAVLAALVLFETDAQGKPSVAYPVLPAAGLGLPLMAALALAGEKRKWGRSRSAGVSLLGLLLLAAYAFTVPTNLPNEPATHMIRLALLAVGLILFAMTAPYLEKGEVNGFWHYNKTLCFRLFVTAVFSIVLYAGLALALAALDNLFGIAVPGKRYGELWVLVAGLFAPWFFLAGIPENLDALEQAEDYPKGLKIFAQYILFTLVIVYLVILYAYLLKILFLWEWPKGWVSSLILGFSATAILSLLLMHPIRDRSGNAWIRSAGKWLYIVLIPLVIVLFLALHERIGDYGITESRYAGIALGTWLSAQVLYFLFSRAQSIKFTLISLCLTSFFVSLGPWGILSVSERSQAGRLQILLAKNGILVDGKVRREHGRVTREDAGEISSIVSYLRRVHGYGAIQPWFADNLKTAATAGLDRYLPAPEVLEKMGVQYVGSRPATGATAFITDSGKPADISGCDRMLRQLSLAKNPVKKEHRFNGEGIYCVASGDLEKLTLRIGHGPAFDTVELDIGAFAEKLSLEFWDADFAISGKMPPDSMALTAERNGLRVKVLFQRLFLTREDGKTGISSYVADIAYTVKRGQSPVSLDEGHW